MSEPIVLLVSGILFKLELIVEEQDLDWLDETILDITSTPQRIGDLLSECFDLPERLLQDAIARLIERHSLLLDVAAGTVRRSTIPSRFHSSAVRGEDVWVWQDYATGTIVLWEQVKPWSRTTGGDQKVVRLQGGPPARTVLEMSDAELLSILEPFRRSAAWSERVRRKERARVENLRVQARLLDDGRVLPEDEGLPWILGLRWQRLAQVGEGIRRHSAEVLPKPWAEIVGVWSQHAHERVNALRSGAPIDAESEYADEVRESLERSASVHHQVAGGSFGLDQVRRAQRMAAAVVADRPNHFGGALSLLRDAPEGAHRLLLLPAGAKPNTSQSERAEAARVTIGRQPRTDQDFLLLDSRRILFGACDVERRRVVGVTWRRPLFAYLAWLTDSGLTHREEDVSQHDPDDIDRLISRMTAFEQLLGELEQTPHVSPGSEDHAFADAAERLSLVERDRMALQDALLETRTITTKLVLPEQLEEIVGSGKASTRIIVRNSNSPLVRFGRNLSSEQLDGTVVWSLTRPDPHPEMRWIEEPGPCEAILIGDIVLLGCWTEESTDAIPPFIALHTADLAAALRQTTNRAIQLK